MRGGVSCNVLHHSSQDRAGLIVLVFKRGISARRPEVASRHLTNVAQKPTVVSERFHLATLSDPLN
jgi:hypothetical protein